jgi:hypothetical protein
MELDHVPVKSTLGDSLGLSIRTSDKQRRQICVSQRDGKQCPSNVVSNAKYNPITFVPVVNPTKK